MASSPKLDVTTAPWRAIDLYVKLAESLRADGYGQDGIDQLTVEHLMALTKGGLRKSDGSVTSPPMPAGSVLRISRNSVELVEDFTKALNEVGQLGQRASLAEVVQNLQWVAFAAVEGATPGKVEEGEKHV